MGDLPGIQPSDLQIQVKDDVLNVSGKRFISRKKVLSFSRLFHIDTTSIDPSKMTAKIIDGVLTITAIKSKKLSGPINIAVTSNPNRHLIEESFAEKEEVIEENEE